MIVCCRLPKLEMPPGPRAESEMSRDQNIIPEVVSCGVYSIQNHTSADTVRRDNSQEDSAHADALDLYLVYSPSTP